MENKQYYTPDISDLFVGYECEIGDFDGWVYHKIEFDYGWLEIPEDFNHRLRTPYLSKEDIEKEGWKHYNGSIFHFINKDNKLYKFIFRENRKEEMEIALYKKNEMTTICLYLGSIKSINEFRKTLSYLNIK